MMRAAGGPAAPSGSALAASPAGGGAAPASEGELPIRPRALSVASQKRRRGRRGGAKKRKRILRASPRASAPARPAPDVPSWEICARIARIIQKRTNGIAGNVEGVDGSINATGAACILRSLRVRGRNFVDLGCGYGWMMAAAIGMGALSGVGIELPANKAQMSIFRGVIEKMQEEKVGFTDSFQPKHEFIHLDINEVFALFYRFIASWHHFVVLYCAVASHARRFAVRVCVLERNGSDDSVRDPASLRELPDTGHYRSISRPQELEGLHGRCSFLSSDPLILVRPPLTNGLVGGSLEQTVADYLNQVPGCTCDWGLLERYPTAMYSSGQQHEVWIIARNRVVCAAGGGGGPSSGATGAGAAAAAAWESWSACAAVNRGLPQLVNLLFVDSEGSESGLSRRLLGGFCGGSGPCSCCAIGHRRCICGPSRTADICRTRSECPFPQASRS